MQLLLLKRNLQYYRKCYQYFPDDEIVNACVHNLSWTHFRSLLRVSDDSARTWYLFEASKEGWSARALDRNISTQYYFRLLQAPKKEVVIAEILKCYVLIDLKMGKITHQDVGQIDMYVRMYDDLKRGPGDNPTIGILLCSETDADIARYSVLHDNDRLFMSKYMTYIK